MTKPDSFTWPRIDNLLDQLGDMKFLSTLDLASGYWHASTSPPRFKREDSIVAPHGLHEFRVMPFGLTNAPAVFNVFQCQRVLMDVNPQAGQGFVTAYIDDIW